MMLWPESRCTVFFMAYPLKTDRASFLSAALQQVESEGIENLAIRSVAAKLGLAPNAIYRYFEKFFAVLLGIYRERPTECALSWQDRNFWARRFR